MMNTDKLGDENIQCYCPECKELVTMECDNSVFCDDCGEHDAVECDNCGELFDSVWGYDDIEEYNKDK